MEYSEETIEKIRREAYEEGYEAAMDKLRRRISCMRCWISPEKRRQRTDKDSLLFERKSDAAQREKHCGAAA